MKTFLLDATNLAMRSVHAMSRSGLSADGVSTGPLLAFVNSLSRHVKEEAPDRLVACWDLGPAVHRIAIDANYKAHRKQPDPDFARTKEDSFALIKRFCSLAGIHQVERTGFEADDLIAHYVSDTVGEIVIASSDKDFLQLLSPRISQIRFSSSGTPTDRWTVDRLEEEIGASGLDFMHALAMAGDASDGVTGLPRVGMKTAVKALKQFGGLGGVLSDYPLAQGHEVQIARNIALVDLLHPVEQPLPPVPQWDPVGPGSASYEYLLGFLIRYRLDSIKARIYDNTLWRSA